MQQSIVKFIALSYRYCSTCFGHYNAHHQEPVKLPLQPLVSVFHTLQLLCPTSGARQTAVRASGFRMNVEVEVFSAVVGLLTNRPRLRTLPIFRSPSNCRFSLWIPYECGGGRVLSRGRFVSDSV